MPAARLAHRDELPMNSNQAVPRTFDWLLKRDFQCHPLFPGQASRVLVSPTLIVRLFIDWRDEYLITQVAARTKEDWETEPDASFVLLDELLIVLGCAKTLPRQDLGGLEEKLVRTSDGMRMCGLIDDQIQTREAIASLVAARAADHVGPSD